MQPMSERKPCIRCERNIDAVARVCPWCNWDQSVPAPAREAAPPAAAEYTPPSETAKLKRKLKFAALGVVMVIAAFGVGYVINSDDAPKSAPETIEEQVARQEAQPTKGAQTVPLVPANEPGGFDAPITSAPVAAPAAGVPTEYQRHDATAVSAAEYNELAARAQAEKKRMQALVDPRSITGRAYQTPVTQRPLRPRPAAPPQEIAQQPAPAAEAPRISARTRPMPISQPMPSLNAHGVTARLELVIGTDGRVKEVSVREGVPGETARLIHAVQNWRFRPATENGQPVEGRYSVDISFQ